MKDDNIYSGDFHHSIISSIYPEAKIDGDNVSLYGDVYPIQPQLRHLVAEHAPVRDIQYSVNDISEALDHSLVPSEQIKSDLIQWMNSDIQYALFSENTGSGKTQSIVDVFDSEDTQMIACFHTREQRHAFVRRCKSPVRTVKSTSEIISSAIVDERLNRVEQALEAFYEDKEKVKQAKDLDSISLTHSSDDMNTSSPVQFEHALKELKAKGLISSAEHDSILKQYRHARYLLTTKHKLAMTSLKFEFLATYSQKDSRLKDIPVFMDEVHLDQVTDAKGNITVYGNDHWEVHRVNPRVDQSRLMDYKICFITAERFIEHELDCKRVRYKKIGEHCKLFSDGLEIARVSSTKTGETRQRIYDLAEGHYPDADIIANAVESEWNLNFVSTRGSNAHADSDEVIIIASFPTSEEIGHCMLSCNVDQGKAVEIILSDTINQMIGRNQGYRDKSGYNKCLLIVTTKMDFDCDYVTDKITSKLAWQRVGFARRQEYYFKELIDALYEYNNLAEKIATYLLMMQERGKDYVSLSDIGNQFELKSRAVGQYLSELEVETTRIRNALKQQMTVVNLKNI